MKWLHSVAFVVVMALVLAACGSTPAAVETPAPAASAAPLPPTPTFEPVVDAEPTVGAEPATAAPTAAPVAISGGALAWRDQILRNDAVIVSVEGLPPPAEGQVYAAWLAGEEQTLPLGPLAEAGGILSLAYASPAQANLLGAFDKVYITQSSAEEAAVAAERVVAAGALPAQALVHVRHVLFSIGVTPGQVGFALGLRQEADELLRHAQFLKDASDAGDLALTKVHAEHIANIIQGSGARDLNGDGRVQNPGDGFGLLVNGSQDGYIKGMVDHARLAAEAADATDGIKLHAGHVQVAGENTRERVEQIQSLVERIAGAYGLPDVQQDVLAVLALSQQTIQGVDVNLDEQVGPVPGEGGVLTAYQHAQLMAGVLLGAPPAEAPSLAAPPPAPAAEPIRVEIGDNTFGPNKITVPLGATVVWTSVGQRPHTVTADDGSFDSGRLENGGTFQQTFTTPGTFSYYCDFHGGKGGEGMAGTVIVAGESAAAPDHGAHAAVPPAPAAPAPTSASAPPVPAPQAPVPAGEVGVEIGDNTFTPKELRVPLGATVVWMSVGQRPHTVTADDGSFDSGRLESGGVFRQTFSSPGTFLYYCDFHGGPGGQAMAGVVIVGDGGAAQAPPPAPAAPEPAAPAPAPAAVTVSMKDFEFGPVELRVKAGTVVTWANDGARPHSATAVDGSFDTGVYGAGESRSATFETPGTFVYYCELHGAPDGSGGMIGTVVVEP
jgi:plastocyanin